MKFMKCTQCGCNKLIKVDSPFYTIDGMVRTSANIYACYECGHLEMFDPSSSRTYRSNVIDLEKSSTELDILKKKLVELDNPIVLKLLEDDCKAIEKQLSNLDITIRQKQEFESKLYELRLKIQNHPQEIKELKRKINELEYHIHNLKEQISNTIIITEK